MDVIIGVDPGLRQTGYAVLQASGPGSHRFRLLEAGLVQTAAGQPLESRLAQLYDGLCELFQQHKPSVVAIEDLYAHYAHPRTAILMGHARGVMLLAAAAAGAQVRSYAPARVKMALAGNGAASKRQMQLMVQSILGLSCVPEPDHVADAIAVGLCHFYCQDGGSRDDGSHPATEYHAGTGVYEDVDGCTGGARAVLAGGRRQ